MGIKSFIYLDEYKMYSISSQIFAGLTEYVIDYSANAESEKEEQKGPIGSGRILADIISREGSIEEKKFLHDYSYTLFEDELIKDGKVLEINSDTVNVNIQKLDDFSFVKITGPSIFNDIEAINGTLTNFNEIGKAMIYVTNFESISSKKKDFEDELEKTTNKNKIRHLKKKMKEQLNIEELTKNSNLHQDEEFLRNLVYLLDYGFKDQFEIQIRLKHNDEDNNQQTKNFSANLNRNHLKEEEGLLIRKYARYTEKAFVIFGIITQSQDLSDEKEIDQNENEPRNLKEAIINMVSKLYEVETTFTGRLKNEIIIDPIAVYREL